MPSRGFDLINRKVNARRKSRAVEEDDSRGIKHSSHSSCGMAWPTGRSLTNLNRVRPEYRSSTGSRKSTPGSRWSSATATRCDSPKHSTIARSHVSSAGLEPIFGWVASSCTCRKALAPAAWLLPDYRVRCSWQWRPHHQAPAGPDYFSHRAIRRLACACDTVRPSSMVLSPRAMPSSRLRRCCSASYVSTSTSKHWKRHAA